MTTREIKTEIQKILDIVPENTLQDLLDYLKQAQEQTKNNTEFSKHLRQILKEDKELLEKLAQ